MKTHIKIYGKVEIAGRPQFFEELVKSGRLHFYPVSKDTDMIQFVDEEFSNESSIDYEIVDCNAEQGRRYVVEIWLKTTCIFKPYTDIFDYVELRGVSTDKDKATITDIAILPF